MAYHNEPLTPRQLWCLIIFLGTLVLENFTADHSITGLNFLPLTLSRLEYHNYYPSTWTVLIFTSVK